MSGRDDAPRPPVLRRLGAAPRSAGSVTVRTLREFVWHDLRDGVPRLGGLPHAIQGVAGAGLLLFGALLALLVLGDVGRRAFALVPVSGGAAGRGTLAPRPLVPVTLFALAVSTAFALVGTLRARAPIRVAVVAVYLALAVTVRGAGAGVDPGNRVAVLAGWAAPAAVASLALAASWKRPAPGIDFAVCLALTTVTFGLAQSELVDADRLGLTDFTATETTNLIRTAVLLGTPLLLAAGLGIADFASRVANWSTQVAAERLRDRSLLAVTVLVAVWRLQSVTREAIDRLAEEGATDALASYGGGLGVLSVIGVTAWWVRRIRPTESRPADADSLREETRPVIPRLVAAFSLGSLALVALLLTYQVASIGLGYHSDALYDRLLDWAGWMQRHGVGGWRTVVALGALAVAGVVTRRGRPGPVLYLAVFGGLEAWRQSTLPGRPLARLGDGGPGPTDACWVLLFCAVGGWWAARRRLDPDRVRALLFLLVLSALVRQADFIADPFRPVLGFTGIGFLAFGVAWQFLTSGAWTNTDSISLPREGRVLLYLGYSLFTVSTVGWFVTTHDLGRVAELTGGTVAEGFSRFGVPLIYAGFAVSLTGRRSTRSG